MGPDGMAEWVERLFPGETYDLRIYPCRFLANALHNQGRERTGWLSIRIMWLSGISALGPGGLVSQLGQHYKVNTSAYCHKWELILTWPKMLLGRKSTTSNQAQSVNKWTTIMSITSETPHRAKSGHLPGTVRYAWNIHAGNMAARSVSCHSLRINE